jgi:hypothetical protein
LKGLWTPAIWRLFETGKRNTWPQARQQVYIDNEIADRGAELRRQRVAASKTILKTSATANGKAKKA